MSRRRERDLRDEVEFHRAMAARAGRPAGEFGPPDLWLEMSRDLRATRWIDDLGRDLRFALRRLRGAPGFALVAVLTLALGIGANSALFTVVDAVMLRRLPVPGAGQLVLLGAPDYDGMESGTADHAVDGLTYQQYLQLRDQNRAFSGLAAFSAFEPTFKLNWGAESDNAVPLKFVSPNYFAVLDLAPARGRFFDSPTAPEAVASYSYWRARPGILGRTLHLRNTTLTVVGVAPHGFTGTTVGQSPDIYIPIGIQPQVFPGADWLHDPPGITRRMWLLAMGRLRPGFSVEQARAEANVIFSESVHAQAAQSGDAATRQGLLTQFLPVAGAATGVSAVRAEFTQPLLILMALVGLVLLVVAVNLGGMLLEQAAGREREFAMRLALGARRGRLVRQLLTESLVLAAAGGLAGFWLAQWGGRFLVSLVASGDTTLALSLNVDLRVLAFTAGICLLAGVGFGLAPAWRLSRADLAQRASQRSPRSAAPALVVAQVAAAIVLVTGSALFARSLANLRSVPLGYRVQNLDTFNLNVGFASVTPARALDIYQRVADAARLLPGVTAVTFSENGLFAGGDSGDGITVEGYTGADASTRMDWVAPGYFTALGIPLRQGREFTADDRGRAIPPVVIDSVLADRYFARRDPLGQTITIHYTYGDHSYQVVGVNAKALQRNLRTDAARPRLYLDADVLNGDRQGVLVANYLVRLAPGAVLNRTPLNALVARVSGLPVQVNTLSTVQSVLDAGLAPDRLMVKLSAFFGILALSLAAMGLYAMLSYAVARRRSELAVRMALGARAQQLVAMVLRRALVLLIVGIAVGGVLSLALGRGLASLLYDLRPSDPASLAAAAALLLAAGLAAALAPALRACHTDPARTLRAE